MDILALERKVDIIAVPEFPGRSTEGKSQAASRFFIDATTGNVAIPSIYSLEHRETTLGIATQKAEVA